MFFVFDCTISVSKFAFNFLPLVLIRDSVRDSKSCISTTARIRMILIYNRFSQVKKETNSFTSLVFFDNQLLQYPASIAYRDEMQLCFS